MTVVSTTTHLIHTAQKPNEALVAGWLFSDADRAVAQTNNWMLVKLGVTKAADIGQANRKIDYLGSWDNRRNVIRARRPIKITGQQDLFYPLAVGDIVVLDITVAGQPTSESGISLECEFRRLGDVREDRDRRPVDDDLMPPRRQGRPAFSLGRHIEDPNVRQAAEALEDQLNTSGVTSFFITYPISVAMGFANAPWDDQDNDTNVGATSSTYQTLETLTLTPPDKRPWLAVIMGRSTYYGAASTGNLRIANTTSGTNGDPVKAYSAAVNECNPASSFWMEEVLDGVAQTYELQGNGGTGGVWDDHKLVGFLVPLEQAIRRLS